MKIQIERNAPMRKLLIVLGTVLASVALSACGGGDDSSQADDFAKEYKPINAKLLATGRVLNSTLVGARGKTNAQLVTEFNVLARDTDTIADELRALDPPDDDKADVEELTDSVATVSATLTKIGDAAAKNDPKRANAETKTLIRQSRALNTAQNKVAADTGAARGAS